MVNTRETTLDDFAHGEFVHDTIRKLDRDTLKDRERIRELVDEVSAIQDMQGMFSNYDYVRLSDGNMFILHGDKHPFGQLRGRPVYSPDPHGDRTFNGDRYVKQEPRSALSFHADFYEKDPVEYGVYRFPMETVEQHIRPETDSAAAVEELGREKYLAYKAVEDVVEAEGAELAVLGSHLLGTHTTDSDLDLAVMSQENVIEDIYYRLEDVDGIDMEIASVTHPVEKKVSQRGHYSTRTIRKRYDVTKEVTALTYSGTPLDILTTQNPGSWTDYYLPPTDEKPEKTEGLKGTVTDASHGHLVPAVYEVDTGTDIVDLVSFLPIFKDVLDEGDTIKMYGYHYPEQSTIYLGTRQHYVQPTRSRIERAVGANNTTDLTVAER